MCGNRRRLRRRGTGRLRRHGRWGRRRENPATCRGSSRGSNGHDGPRRWITPGEYCVLGPDGYQLPPMEFLPYLEREGLSGRRVETKRDTPVGSPDGPDETQLGTGCVIRSGDCRDNRNPECGGPAQRASRHWPASRGACGRIEEPFQISKRPRRRRAPSGECPQICSVQVQSGRSAITDGA